MKTFFNLFTGMSFAFSGFKLISQPGIRRFVMIPLSINICLFASAVYLLVSQFKQWLESLLPDFPDWLGWLESAIYWLLWPLFSLMIIVLVFYIFTFVANLIASPFNSLLAEKIEALLKQQPLDTGPSFPLWKDIIKSIATEIGKLFYLIRWFILLLIISFIPVVNLAAPALWIIFGAWMLSIEYLDYPMGNHRQTYKQIKNQKLEHKSQSMGFGFGVFILTSIPLLNFLAMPASVAGATALWLEQEKTN
jgi:CysZ protein